MLQARDVLPAGSFDAACRRDEVLLDYDRRCRRRLVLTAASGLRFLLDLPAARHLRDGDGLLLDDGTVIAVRAAPEPLLDLRADSAAGLVRLAWHLGNRHVAAELRTDGLRIRRDHVLADLARRLGATVVEVEAPYDPEGGAYAGTGHGHAHGEDPGHRHDHGHGHAPVHATGRRPPANGAAGPRPDPDGGVA